MTNQTINRRGTVEISIVFEATEKTIVALPEGEVEVEFLRPVIDHPGPFDPRIARLMKLRHQHHEHDLE